MLKINKMVHAHLNHKLYSYSNIYTNTKSKLYNYFKNTPHFVFMDSGFPTISKKLSFPNVSRITIVKSNQLLIKNMVYANMFPNLNYIREFVHISTPESKVVQTEKLLHNMVEHNHNIIDYEVLFLDFTSSLHLDIKKITNNFSGFNIGYINNKEYSDYLYEFLRTTHEDKTHDVQEIEERLFQKENVLNEINKNNDIYLC